MSKKQKLDTLTGIRKDERGIREIPDTLRRHARMSKRQVRLSLFCAGLLIVLIAALMIFAQNRADSILSANDDATVLKKATGAEYIDIINNGTALVLREGASGEAKYLEDGRRVIILRRSGLDKEDYWFTVFTPEQAEECRKVFTTKKINSSLIPLESEGDQTLWIFKAKENDVGGTITEMLASAGIEAEFVCLNNMVGHALDAETEKTAGEGGETSLLDEMLNRFLFIQYSYNEKNTDLELITGTNAEKAIVRQNNSVLQIILVVLVVLLIIAAGVLVYTLKNSNFLSKDPHQQKVVRLAVLAVAVLLTAALVFVSVKSTAQNDKLNTISSRYYATVVESEEEQQAATEPGDDEDIAFRFMTSQILNPAMALYLDGETLLLDKNGNPQQFSIKDEETGRNIRVNAYTDGETPLLDSKGVQRTTPARDENGNRIDPTEIITYRVATAAEASRNTGAWRIIAYAAMILLVAVFFALLYYFRYERDIGFPLFNTAILIVLMIITLYPVLNTVAYSFSSGNAASRGNIGLLPQEFTTKSYQHILDEKMYSAFGISVAKTVITTLLNLFWTGMLAFTLTRKEYVLGRFITIIMVLTMYVNAGMIPNFLLIYKYLGLKNTFWVYIIPTMFSCFNMIVIRTYIASLPGELVESARIDGAGDFRIYWQIIFPLCAPVLATVALFVAVGAWNSWFDTKLYADTDGLRTLQFVLMQKVSSAGQSVNLAQTSSAAATDLAKTTLNSRTVQCATTVVTALPILVIYPFLQRYFVTGMALGSVKG